MVHASLVPQTAGRCLPSWVSSSQDGVYDFKFTVWLCLTQFVILQWFKATGLCSSLSIWKDWLRVLGCMVLGFSVPRCRVQGLGFWGVGLTVLGFRFLWFSRSENTCSIYAVWNKSLSTSSFASGARALNTHNFGPAFSCKLSKDSTPQFWNTFLIPLQNPTCTLGKRYIEFSEWVGRKQKHMEGHLFRFVCFWAIKNNFLMVWVEDQSTIRKEYELVCCQEIQTCT